jgi:2-keto-3-deoxy-L-rhamnonate aldolase RhmA
VRTRFIAFAAALTALAGVGPAPAQAQHLNPLVDLLAAKQPVFGLYAPANPRAGRGGRGGPPGAAGAAQPTSPPTLVVAPPPQKTPAELAQDAIKRSPNDYLFDGSMEGAANFDRSLETFSAFMAGYAAAGSPAERWKHPLVVKMHEIAPDVEKAKASIGRQLNTGVSSIAFVTVESADEVRTGIAAMRFKSKGGTRSDDVGSAPGFWGLSEKEYKEKADVWPINPRGELLNWTIVESKPGLEKIREIAAVPGIGVLVPGAGTLGGVFRKLDANGQPVLDANGRPQRDDAAWEAALQKVLDACNEFKIPCGFPANDVATMEMRYKQGFRVFIVGWSENGFKTVDAGVALRK